MLTTRRSALAVALAAVLAPSAAFAQDLQCNTCEDCTRLLATADARVDLGADLSLRGDGPCVVIRGAGARLNGHGHVILAQPGGGVGVRVEAANVGARRLRVTGADVGVVVSNAHDVTLYDVTVEARATGFSIERSPRLCLERVRSTGGRVGLSFGASAEGACPDHTSMQSPGAVVVRSTFERATTGIAACDARPVLTGNTVTRNDVGVVLGDPAPSSGPGGAAPYDACACAPEVAEVHPGSVAMYSSGCGSCQVHEGWLPTLHREHVDIVVRESGPNTQDAQERFDRYGWRCMPGVMDSLGIPGCVPNYGCVTSGAFTKRREGESELSVEVSITGSEDARRFADECATTARGRYVRGARCVAQGLADNRLCGNRTTDLRALGNASRTGGTRDRCDRAEGWREDGRDGCASPCETPSNAAPAPQPQPVAPEPPRAPTSEPDTTRPPATPLAAGSQPTPTPAAPRAAPAVARAAPDAPVTAPRPSAPEAPSSDTPLYIVGALVAVAVAGAWLFRAKPRV